jgi:hypothetical protein
MCSWGGQIPRCAVVGQSNPMIQKASCSLQEMAGFDAFVPGTPPFK